MVQTGTWPKWLTLCLGVLAMLSFSACESTEESWDLAGIPSVTDGDTFEIGGERIRLHGIDAPESGQLCRKDGENWRCGQQSALALDQLVSGKTVFCNIKDVDRYDRKVCECFVEDININAWMVVNGWAVAYRRFSTDYVAQEEQAQRDGAGIWAGEFVMPSDWRRGQRLPGNEGGNQPPDPNCPIKGNINSQGDKIYHVPGGRFYAQTVIDTSEGERWFCTEEEAVAAGWRKSAQ